MKVAILIHVHQDAHQVGRLVERLLHHDVDIYINVDAKSNHLEFEQNVSNKAIFIKNSIEVIWGRFSQVQQILNSFKEIKDSETEYSHVIFISGQDYPIVSIDTVLGFLKEHKGQSFVDYHLVSKDRDNEWNKVIHRRFEYWYFLPENDIRSKISVRRFLKMMGYRRKYPFTDIYYGACWFTFSSEAIEYVLKYIDNHTDIINFFSHTGCADELFFQSILMNSPLKEKIVNNHFRYIDWEEGGKSPKDLTIADFDKIKNSDAWFARKINPQIEDGLTNLLDDSIIRRQKENKL